MEKARLRKAPKDLKCLLSIFQSEVIIPSPAPVLQHSP